jgi:hypothetical protein
MAGEEHTGTGHRASEPAGDPEAWFPPWIGPLAIALASVLLTAWSWEKWADVHIDFGNELYVAWRLAEGDALYGDIAQRNGPFSHYLNAVWFELFGVSIRTLVFCNLAVLAAICAMSWRIFRRACGRFTATATTLVLLGVFAFSQYVGIGNYNYVTPYHHSQTHGLALSLAMLLAFGEALRRAPAGWCAVAGAALGCVFLTKAELFLPAAAAAAFGLALVVVTARERALPAAGVFAAMALLPTGAFFLYLGARMPAGLAWQGVLGNWMHLGSESFGDPFYARIAGFDDVRGNLLAMLGAFAGIAVFAAVSLGADRLLARSRAALPASAAAGAALFGVLVAWPTLVPWSELARALPLTAGLACSGLIAVCARQRGDREALARWGPLALYALLALALLAKLALRVRFGHYGFVLAMPATLLLVASLLHLLPARIAPGRGVLARALVTGALAAGVVFFLGRSSEFYRRKDFPVGEGADRILAPSPFTSPRPQLIALALERLETLVPAQGTLLVLPEGIGLNYWLRRRNPIRHNLFLPTEIRAFGEEAMLAELRAHPPDAVALVHRRSDEFGVGSFGVDPRNGRRLMAWVERGYRRVARLGAEPFGNQGFGVVLLRRAGPGGGS